MGRRDKAVLQRESVKQSRRESACFFIEDITTKLESKSKFTDNQLSNMSKTQLYHTLRTLAMNADTNVSNDTDILDTVIAMKDSEDVAGMKDLVRELQGSSSRQTATNNVNQLNKDSNSSKIADKESNAKKSKINYRKTFFEAYPETEGKVVVHHAIEQQVLTRYNERANFTEEEINQIDNLRGIPSKINSDLHLSKIRLKWNDFYREYPNPTKEQLRTKALEIDNQFGHLFNPKIQK